MGRDTPLNSPARFESSDGDLLTMELALVFLRTLDDTLSPLRQDKQVLAQFAAAESNEKVFWRPFLWIPAHSVRGEHRAG